MITLQPISEDNVYDVLALKADDQFVAPNSESLAEAYLSIRSAIDDKKHYTDVPYAILKDEVVVGFLMIAYEDGEDVYSDDGNIYWLSRFMIDEKYQNKGFGKEALMKLIDYIKTKPDGNEAKSFYTSVIPDNYVATKFYVSAGFKKTGKLLEDEEIMRLIL